MSKWQWGFAGLLVTWGVYAEASTLAVPGAYPSIQAAIDAAQLGDTVEVQAGQHEGPLVFKEGIHLTGEGCEKVTVRCPVASGSVLEAVNCASGSISGIAFEHVNRDDVSPSAENIPPVLKLENSGVELSICAVRNGKAIGLLIAGNGASAVRKCVIEKNGASGVCLLGGTTASVEKSECKENGGNGIWVSGQGTSPSLLENRCFKNGGAGICFDGGSSGLARKNECSENAGSGMTALGQNSTPSFESSECKDNKMYGIAWDDTSFPTMMGCILTNNRWINSADVFPLLAEDRFPELDALAARLRKIKMESVAQRNELAAFYSFLKVDGDANARLDKFDRWMKVNAQSMAARIGLAEAHIKTAWAARGSGFSDTVTEKGWNVFYAEIAKARDILVEAESLDEKDPYLYRSLVAVSLWTKHDAPSLLDRLSATFLGTKTAGSDVERYFQQGIALDPLFLPLYESRAYTLLPRWGGSSGELERFAETTTENMPENQSDALYALIARYVITYEDQEDIRSRYKFSWPRVQKGFRDILAVLPDEADMLDKFRYAACVYKDQKIAAEVFEKMETLSKGRKWKGIDAAYRKWAIEGAAYPERPPLIAAIIDKNTEEVRRLLDGGADANACDMDEETAMYGAVSQRDVEIVRLLLDRGADPNVPSGDGWVPVALAAHQRYTEIVELLLDRGAKVDARFEDGSSLLQNSIEWNAPEMTRILLKHGADPNLRREGGATPLMRAVEHQDLELTRELLEHGADSNAEAANGWSVLEEAVDRGNIEIARLLLEKGADVNHQEKDGWSVLHMATRGKTTEALEMLLAVKGVNVNLKSAELETPLHAAAKKGMTEAAEILLNAGAEVNPKNKNGLTPLGSAKAGKYDATVALLAKHGGVE